MKIKDIVSKMKGMQSNSGINAKDGRLAKLSPLQNSKGMAKTKNSGETSSMANNHQWKQRIGKDNNSKSEKEG